jgi:hypothetical protein
MIFPVSKSFFQEKPWLKKIISPFCSSLHPSSLLLNTVNIPICTVLSASASVSKITAAYLYGKCARHFDLLEEEEIAGMEQAVQSAYSVPDISSK